MTKIASNGLSAEFSTRGAELVKLQTAEHHDLLWNGDAKWWGGRSPLLFPIVGRAPDDAVLIDGRHYPLLQHGFARTADFICTTTEPDHCAFRLQANTETRTRYPFDFTLDIDYRISDDSLDATATVRNDSDKVMPFSFGFHPALLWPLPFGGAREEHELMLEHDETAPVRRTIDGLLSGVDDPTPAHDRHIALKDELFNDGVVIFRGIRSRTIVYGVKGKTRIRLDFPDLPDLGIWTKPGAGFICIEPWHGYAAPVGFTGELASKPGIAHLQPNTARSFSMRIKLQTP